MQQGNASVSFGINDLSRSRINDDDTRRQFEYSIASIADINTNGKRENVVNNFRSDGRSKNSETQDLREKKYSVDRIKNKHEKVFKMNKNIDVGNYSTDFKTFENKLGYSKKNQHSPVNTSPCIEITYLKPAVSKQSRKFSKIKSGKINPHRSNFSIKKTQKKRLEIMKRN